MGDRNEALCDESRKVLVGGVNSPVRAIEPYPFSTASASGAIIVDAAGARYLDYCMGYGPLILGHAHPAVVKAIQEQASRGTLYGTPTEAELRLAQRVCSLVPGAERVRFVSTGTEATMTAVRLARGITGREVIVKVAGAFHGAQDSLLVAAGSGAMTHGVATSAGVPADLAAKTRVIPFNDLPSLERALAPGDVAAMILEPVMANAGCILPEAGYLEGVRRRTREAGALLIFDEVVTGFRLAPGGAQERFGVRADLVTLGKVLGGGLPLAAIAGPASHMEHLAPKGRVYNAGTFNGNPLSVTAGLVTLEVLTAGSGAAYRGLEDAGKEIRAAVQDLCRDRRIPARVQGIASMFQVYFGAGGREVRNLDDAKAADAARFGAFQRRLLTEGVFLPPSQFECNFLSTAHGPEERRRTIEAMAAALQVDG